MRRNSILLGAAALLALGMASGIHASRAAANPCRFGDSISLSEFDGARAAGCNLTGKKIVVNTVFQPEVPGPDEMYVLQADPIAGGTEVYAIAQSRGGEVAMNINGAMRGSKEAIQDLSARMQPHGNTHQATQQDAPEAVPLGGCGSPDSHSLLYSQEGALSVWPTITGYRWYYNPSGQVSTNTVDLLKQSFNYAVADSSTCGTGATSTIWSYRGSTTRDGKTKDGYSVIAWEVIPGYLGLAGYHNNANTTVEADIRLNPSASWHMSTSLPVPAGKKDFITIGTHEVLHNWALGHVTYDDGQVMYEGVGVPSGAGTDRRSKRSGDLAGFDKLYT